MGDLVPGASPSRHDLLLALVGVPLALAALVAAMLPVSFGLALAAGSVPAGGGVGYALFYRPPTTRT